MKKKELFEKANMSNSNRKLGQLSSPMLPPMSVTSSFNDKKQLFRYTSDYYEK